MLLLVAAVVVLVEALAYTVLAALDLADLSSERVGSGLGVALVLVLYGLGQLVAMRLLLRGVAAARSPLVVTQILQVLVATSLRDQAGLALAVGLPAVVVLICLLAPPVTRALAVDAGTERP